MEEHVMLKTLSDLQDLIYRSSFTTTCLQEVKDKDIVLFMGNTRAGKSTIVNYVIGNPLKAEHVTKNRYRINNVSSDFTGPKIGIESTSETTVPTAWTSNRINGIIVDAPGFDDNRGEAQDIANVYHIRNILTSAKSVKIVLILDINDIAGDNIGQCVSLVDKIKLMFPDIGQQLNTAITLVINKDNNNTTKNEVCEYFNNKILSQPLMNVKNRELVQYLCDRPCQIVLIQMPDSERDLSINDVVFDDLINTIENVSSRVDGVYFQNIKFGLSDKSKAFLYTAHTRLSEHQDFENAFNTCTSMFTQRVNQYDIGFGDINHGNNMKNELQTLDGQIKEKINRNMNVNESLQALNELTPNNGAINEEIYKKVSFITFVDQILSIDNSENLKVTIKTTLSYLKSLVIQKIAAIQERMAQLQHEENERKRIAEEERIRKENEELERLKREHEEQQRRLAELTRQTCGGRRGPECVMQ